jgi:hypothetical protein
MATTMTTTTATTPLTPKEQLDQIWESLTERNSANGDKDDLEKKERKWPSYDEVLANIAAADYNDILRCPHDLKGHNEHDKSLCPFGVVCQAKIEIFSVPSSSRAYSGLLTPNTTLDHCLIRLSSGIKPPGLELKNTLSRAILRTTGDKLRKAKLFPTSAIKIFRGKNAPSGNMLFAGSKVGQREEDYFSNCQCTQLTEQMPFSIKPFIRKFWKYSDYPFALGLSDLCWYDGEGVQADPEDLNFPFCLVLHPIHRLVHQPSATASKDSANFNSFDRFLDDVVHIQAGTHLFDLYACPDPKAVPHPEKLQRIGRVTSTSDMVSSAPNDGLFFKHQRKEEDFMFKPEWKEDTKATQCSINDGKTVGTVNKLAGWKVFESHIAKKGYDDCERSKV